jgi:hypothetical protein
MQIAAVLLSSGVKTLGENSESAWIEFTTID